MADDASVKIVDEITMKNALNRNFTRLFNSICEANDLSRTSDALIHLPQTANDIWEYVNEAVTVNAHASSQQIQQVHNTSSFAILSKHRQYIDRILKAEIEPVYVEIPQFHSVFFGCVQDSAYLPPTKRPRLSSPNNTSQKPPNCIHRRVILRDHGKPIYTASTHSILLTILEIYITGHQSLHKTGILHQDISPNNLLVNENKNNNNNPSWPAFIIDLDLAIREQRDIPAPEAHGSKKTGTRPFLAIGALMGEKHSFMHDLESLFWMIFWICVHYEAPGRKGRRAVAIFDRWNFVDTGDLAVMKQGFVFNEEDFLRWADGRWKIWDCMSG
ncbi:hypothetical protein BO85DRAFT_435235 [Aspergillus piperis CBS 112811]|uniref:non-specific serine/threonine protein kinase n=1 Tax=Aspergillus piperis CBS 112811 TaxID=1448313 RepID=A0A8G1R7T7_9EURO|nr:hypothetical protein BO85DRAFT_435235 [Aspergillus piperis CBS 112811]RAH60903.1 hypothetical protein BO85DRAFT_435235 [Aspergillus piperis CBS 112811]